MATAKGAERTYDSSSVLRLEALFPHEGAECAGGEVNPELTRLRDHLLEWLWQYEPVILWVQRLLVWERPLHSIFVAFMLNTVFWLITSTSMRPLFLLSVSLLGLVLLEKWKHKLPRISVSSPEEATAEGESGAIRPRLLSVPELSQHLAESYQAFCLHLRETAQYKRQNPGMFCGLVCAACLLLAVVGHYIPGVMISYIMLLSVLLWPLVVYNELIQKMYTGLEPILMKLDYSMKGDTEHRKHEKKKVKKEAEESDEPRVETESESEEELSCLVPTVDAKTTALAMAITDSELSDEEASILESGGFSVSRANTPQLGDLCEDLDQQTCQASEQEDGSPQNPAELPATVGTTAPLHCTARPQGAAVYSGSPDSDGKRRGLLGDTQSLEALSEEIVSSAISTVVQNTLSALTRLDSSPTEQDATTGQTEMDTSDRTACAAQEDEEEEEFVLLDQSELEQMEEELGMLPKGEERDLPMPTDLPRPQFQDS
ncbi:hypothetical protein GJAV_G00211150 [Gymnothorax javanicus]|nr:hypothetical protein GJAV_G00211150 [Gymnothorax javanicus]